MTAAIGMAIAHTIILFLLTWQSWYYRRARR